MAKCAECGKGLLAKDRAAGECGRCGKNLNGKPFEIGQIIKVRLPTFMGTYKVMGYDADGSVRMWGGPKHQFSFRNAMPEKCMATKQAGPAPINGAPRPHNTGRKFVRKTEKIFDKVVTEKFGGVHPDDMPDDDEFEEFF